MLPSCLHRAGDQRVDLGFDLDARLQFAGKIGACGLGGLRQRIILAERLGIVALIDRNLDARDGFRRAGTLDGADRPDLDQRFGARQQVLQQPGILIDRRCRRRPSPLAAASICDAISVRVGTPFSA